MIFLADSNRPDSGLYHYPFIGLINNEKISFGITNINVRFGVISSLQYLQAINNNLLFGFNGMTLPIAILPSVIFLYFVFEIFRFKKLKNRNYLYLIFLFLSLIFFTYKMNRYGAYGNDFLGHYMIFYMISLLIKMKRKIDLTAIIFYCTYLFTLKITHLYIFILPIILLFNFNTKIKINKSFFISIFFIFIWFLKTLFHTACIIWPVNKSCFQNLFWFNSYHKPNSAKFLSNIGEAWSKGWPAKIKKYANFEDYNQNFEWFHVWLGSHGLFIAKVISIYFLILFLILYFLKKIKKIKYNNHIKDTDKKILFNILIVFLLGLVVWFFKYPVYRFGIAPIIIPIITIILLVNIKIKLTNKHINLIKKISIFCILIFIGKNLIKFKNFDYYYNNYPWPKFYSFDNKNNHEFKKKIYINDNDFYLLSEKLCMYTRYICNNEQLPDKLKLKKILNYKFYYYDN